MPAAMRRRIFASAVLHAVAFCSAACAWAQSSQPEGVFPNLDAGKSPTPVEPLRRVQSMALLLLVSTLLFLVFVIFIYFLFRRRLEAKPDRKPTKYVDAWSSYRLSEASIKAATTEDAGADPRPPRGDDENDERIWDDDAPDEPHDDRRR